MSDKEIVCFCSNVTKEDIVKALNRGAKNLEDIKKITGACTQGRCKELSPKNRCCASDIIEIIQEYSE